MHRRCFEDRLESILDDVGVDHLHCPEKLKAPRKRANMAIVAEMGPPQVGEAIVHKVEKVIVCRFIHPHQGDGWVN
jgi:hypothetical protein